MKLIKLVALATAGVALSAGSAAAQACMGMPIGNANFAARGEVGFADGGKSYTANLNANLLGPLAFELFGGLVDFDDIEDNGATFGGKVAYELGLANVSVCPLVGADYTTISAEEAGVEASASTLVVPVGVGVGVALPAGGLGDVVLYAQPSYLYMRFSAEEGDEDFSDSTNEFGAEAGATLGLGRFLVGGSVFFTTVEDSDAVFSLTAGLRFGR